MDFPLQKVFFLPALKYESHPCHWTEWINSGAKEENQTEEIEMLENLIQSGLQCDRVFDIEARTAENKTHLNETKELVFKDFNINKGVHCLDTDQSNNKQCPDIEIRVCCQSKVVIICQ